MARPTLGTSKRVKVSYTIDPKTKKKLEYIAQHDGISVSQLLDEVAKQWYHDTFKHPPTEFGEQTRLEEC